MTALKITLQVIVVLLSFVLTLLILMRPCITMNANSYSVRTDTPLHITYGVWVANDQLITGNHRYLPIE